MYASIFKSNNNTNKKTNVNGDEDEEKTNRVHPVCPFIAIYFHNLFESEPLDISRFFSSTACVQQTNRARACVIFVA